MTPLDTIKNWFLSLSTQDQYEVAALAGHFHLDLRIDGTIGKEPKIQLFLDYLNPRTLDDSEIVKRTLYIIKLIDFSFEGRDTEEGWTESFDRLLSMRAKLREEDQPTDFIDKQLNNHQERKGIWLEISGSWEAVKNHSLTNKQIGEWYFSSYIKRAKK
ncbi:MAG: hypothetical protein V4549_00405 [Bacteroidota bacterium]